MEQRISYKVLPGAGDDGVCKLNCRNLPKSDLLNDFYYFTEELQVAVGDAKLFGEYSSSSCYNLLDFLEQAIPALNAFYYSLTQNPRLEILEQYCFTNEQLSKINSTIKELHPKYGGSKEFQIFSNDVNIHYLNKIRVKIRRLELQYHKSLNVLPEDLTLSPYKLIVSKVLNRLSSLIWDYMLKEEVDCKITPYYWQGKMPSLNL